MGSSRGDLQRLRADYCGGRYVQSIEEVDSDPPEPTRTPPPPAFDARELVKGVQSTLKPIQPYGRPRRDRR